MNALSEVSLPPYHSVEPGVDGDTIYVTSVRRSIGIEDNDQGQVVVEKLRSVWDEAADVAGRVTVLEVYYGERLGYEKASALGATFLWVLSGGDYDHFLQVTQSGYNFLQEDKAKLQGAEPNQP